MSRGRRLILWLVLSLLGLSGLLYFLLFSEQGLQFVWRQAQAQLPPEWHIDSLQGSLAGPLRVNGLHFRDAHYSMELSEARLDWTPMALLSGRLRLDRLQLKGLELRQLQISAAASGQGVRLPEAVRLPLAVALSEFDLQRAAYYPHSEDEPVLLDRLQLALKADRQEISISELRLLSPLLDVEGSARLGNGRGYPLRGGFEWQLRLPEYPAVDGVTGLDGSLQQLSLTQTLAAPYNARADVVIDRPLESARFEASLSVSAVDLRELHRDLPDYTLTLQAEGAGEAKDNRFEARLETRHQELGRVEISFSGGMTDSILNLGQLLLNLPDRDASARLSGTLAFSGVQPEARLQVSWRRLRWPLQGKPVMESPSGNAKLSGTLDDIAADFELMLADQGRVMGQIRRQREALGLQLEWENLAWPQDAPEINLPQGSLQADGSAADYGFTIKTRVDVPGRAGGRIELRGVGDRESLTVETLDAAVLQGWLGGNAEIRWLPEVSAEFDLTGGGLDPGVLLADWPGSLGIKLRGSLQLKDRQVAAQAERLLVEGELRGYPLRLEARGVYGDAGLRLATASLVSGGTQLTASGLLSDQLELDWQLRSDDLASLSPDASGRLEGKGSVRGTPLVPHLVADLEGEELGFAGDRVQRLRLHADLRLDESQRSELAFELADARLAGIPVHRLALDGGGTPAAHQLHLSAETDRGGGELSVDGAWREQNWRFVLRQGRFAYPGLQPWTLAASAPGRLSMDFQRIQLDENCWNSNEARLCFEAGRAAAEWHGAFQLQTLPLGYLAPLLPNNLVWAGDLGGRGRLQGRLGDGGPLRADLALHTSAGRLSSSEPEQSTLIDLGPGRARLQLDHQRLEIELDLPFAETGGLVLDARTSGSKADLLQQPLSGSLRLLVPDVAVFTHLLPEVERFQGRLAGEARLSGTLGAPDFDGGLRLSDGVVELITAGITLDRVQAELNGGGDGELQLSLEAASGPGRLRVVGTARKLPAGLTAELAVSGEDFQLLDTPQAEVRVSPDLKLRLGEQKLVVDGDLPVPYARVKLKTLPDSAVAPSGDQVIVQDQEAQQDGADERPLHARVRVLLGDRVTFDGLGLKARFKGNLLIIEQPGQLTTASGEIVIPEGSYRAYGQNLTIERGRLFFAGGLLTEPGLDIRAVRRPAPDITVGVEARGNLNKPELELFSEPSMSQSEQLSYLVLGQPLQGGASDQESSAMNRAAIALGLAGGGAVAESIGEQVGFDSVGIEKGEGESTEDAALVVGKFLSPKLYISYGIGLFEPISTIWLRYSINKNWKLVSETSTVGSGADIYYTIDRGR